MDSITFKSETVLSDVHMYTPNTRHLMVRLNAVGQPVFVSKFKILRNISVCDKEDLGDFSSEENRVLDADDALTGQMGCSNATASEKKFEVTKETVHTEILLDDDGDLDVIRRPVDFLHCSEKSLRRDKVYPTILSKGEEFSSEEYEEDCSICNEIRIEHTMDTTLEDVGKQVWRGAFLLADYILNNSYLFRDCTVLELGAGTGLTSIVMATVAKTIYCTDVGEDLLNMCERNIIVNKNIYEAAGSEIKVRELDWLRDELCTDTKNPYCWSEEEIAHLYDHTDVLLAADVFYDDDLTDGFFQTIYRILSNLKNPSTIYLSVEKRLNFTLRKMDVTCDAYDHFRLCLADLQNICDGKTKFVVEPIKRSFPQFLLYERVEQLELWKIIAEPLKSNTQ
ncbi:methyltransferase-like protein 22 [Stegostoma tigrinum]|uniref:methyltransferase-like protein 22 n=1 Tax=Stegostoma tigrinum TaxID=3053191 RepID=UPI00202B6F87|nr:methyltransferase-like protein 22 [Stegostoma tigrinum]XP_048408267.1 methyltransferase-like protein 22 [Stegostoma tigrinum]XP_048408268.1 methyltransferase-like protein 22 [Stegostoma tigrinum]XP_048408269.1 methyltransferase-like protein 22 [Stegostoma tigrinum]XP_048408270.1 methyltransferase-like protein 22 [Stegostoma tigrinum]